jgi:predicted transcriptional regulator
MELREKYNLSPSEKLRNLMREQAKIKGKITKAVATQKKTIPEIAKEIELDVHTTSYYVLTLTHYKLLEPSEKGEDGYWKYKLAKGGR